LNQAHALASRARGQLERSLGALLVARTGRQACAELDAILADWDGTLTILMRKRVSRHIENCAICGERKRRALSPAALFSVLPLVGLPPGLRHQVLRLVSDGSPEAIKYRGHVVARAGRFGPNGFPIQLSPAGHARRRGIRAHPVPYAVAAALIVLAGSGSAAYALKHDHKVAASQHPGSVTVTITASAPTGEPTPTPSVTPTIAPVVVTSSPSPSPSVSPGTLQVSPSPFVVKVPPPLMPSQSPQTPPYTGTFMLTAMGGPVTYSVSVPSSEQPYMTITPASGTLGAGQQQVMTVTVSSTANPKPPYRNTATVNPGGIVVIIYYTPSG
jgi:hypothetical protein